MCVELIFKIVTHKTCHCSVKRVQEQVPGGLLLFWELTLRFLDDGESRAGSQGAAAARSVGRCSYGEQGTVGIY